MRSPAQIERRETMEHSWDWQGCVINEVTFYIAEFNISISYVNRMKSLGYTLLM